MIKISGSLYSVGSVVVNVSTIKISMSISKLMQWLFCEPITLICCFALFYQFISVLASSCFCVYQFI